MNTGTAKAFRLPRLRRLSRLGAWIPVLLLLFLLLGGVRPPSHVFADAVIYYRKDSKGVAHLTNRRSKASGYQVYMVFRDILRRHPGLDREKIIQLAKKHGQRYGIDASLVQAVIEVESGYKVNAVSSAGAEGLMQIMPQTQQELGLEDSFDPDANVHAGVRYLKKMLDRFGSLHLALAAYNAGPGRVDKYQGIPPFPETQAYVKNVMARYRRIKTGS